MKIGPRMIAAAALVAPCGCSREARTLGPEQPITAPVSDTDARIPYFQDNVYQVSQGGRYFGWYGCGGCHRLATPGVLNLFDGRWRHGGGFDQVYRAIADGHGQLAYGARVPAQQLWQITAYVRGLPQQSLEKLRRQERDQLGEPTAASWNGALR